ncbi:GlxA family transcriptional regulator [Paraburkholderia lacunae]|uniref:AraC family transcriptional regulator n=1 Tax=Paraburkholderia lacunae TaxID=2211104 RepID=A0A370N5N5_9BURK|nr:helix-turn-helix domain-containing protein [Paraburkholderia lacunae]RDK00920.1 AraC family transcriptional regulator [Paraburkholderia lacunae]
MKNYSKDYRRHATQPHGLPDDRPVRRVGLTLFSGFSLPEASLILEAFHFANALSEAGGVIGLRFDVYLLSVMGGKIASSSSVSVWTDSIDSRSREDSFHALFIAGGAGVQNALRDERLITWLQQIHSRSERIFPISEGRLLLQAAGFRPADGDPLQAALSLIGENLGVEVVRQIAQRLELQFESQSTEMVRKNTPIIVSEQIQASARWLEMNADRAIAMDEVAQVASMSERNFLRRFKLEMGKTPSDYLLFVRLDMCCRLLAETDLPVDKIARRCGLSSGGRLSKILRRHLGITPTEYRASRRQLTDSK